MKKKLLFSLIGATLINFSFAQDTDTEINYAGTELSADEIELLNHQSQARLTNLKTEREAINGWVSYELNEYELYGSTSSFNTYGRVVSPDSLPLIGYSDGHFQSYFHGFGQIFDPTSLDLEYGKMTSSDNYSIDSIGFPSIYRRVNHNGIDDTIVITMVVTNKVTTAENPFDGGYVWGGSGLIGSEDISMMAPSYAGTAAQGNHYGLTGFTDGGADVTVTKYKFALTDDDTDILWRSFPVDIEVGADQAVYSFVEFQPSFIATSDDTVFVFDGGDGLATTNSYRTVYDTPIGSNGGYFFDINREDKYSFNGSYTLYSNTRYGAYTGDSDWRNNRLGATSTWGFRFEYYVNGVSSIGIEEEIVNEKLSIYPNPTNGEFTLAIGNGENLLGEITIQDIAGRVIYTEQVNATGTVLLNSMNLKAGVYLVSLTTNDKKYSQKLIVE